jgi:hypothetical protein
MDPMTYGGLEEAVRTWLVRADLAARAPEFIALAEVRLRRLLGPDFCLNQQPDVSLFAALSEAGPLLDPELAATYEARCMRAVREIRAASSCVTAA